MFVWKFSCPQQLGKNAFHPQVKTPSGREGGQRRRCRFNSEESLVKAMPSYSKQQPREGEKVKAKLITVHVDGRGADNAHPPVITPSKLDIWSDFVKDLLCNLKR